MRRAVLPGMVLALAATTPVTVQIVTVRAPNGATFKMSLPFDRPIPAQPKQKKREHSHRRR